MAFFNQAVTVLQSLVVAIGAILSIWGGINLLEGSGTGCETEGKTACDERKERTGNRVTDSFTRLAARLDLQNIIESSATATRLLSLPEDR